MDDNFKQALEIVKAQAAVRVMSEEEITSMVRALATNFKNMEDGACEKECASTPSVPPAKAIKEKTITCLECGKVFKILTRKHLAMHGLDPESYRAKWGMKKGTPLVCKDLQRERRKKMKDMRLWEKRRAASDIRKA